jgi:ATP-dependent Clp protease ATP-binding subunit ClpB
MEATTLQKEPAVINNIENVMHIAKSIATEHSHKTFSNPHLLKALLHEDAGLLPILASLDKDWYFMEEWADVRLEQYPKAVLKGEAVMDSNVESVLDEADYVRIKQQKDIVDSLCLLAALCTPGIGFSYDQLKSFPLTREELINAGNGTHKNNGATFFANEQKGNVATTTNALAKYCINKIEAVTKTEVIITGRDKELRMMNEILCRLSKPNVLITGDAGVGKTTLTNGFVKEVINKNVPAILLTNNIFELDNGSLIAGASYKGEVEDRLKNIFKELKQFEKPILIIDELHVLLDKQGAAAGAANILKPEIAKGEVTVIATTSLDEYRKHIEKDEGFNRQFETLMLEEPDASTAYQMIKKVMPIYEKHHDITIAEDTIYETIRLAKRFVKEKRLPDAAIDLADRAMAGLKLINEKGEAEVIELEKIFNAQKLQIEPISTLQDWQWLYKQTKQKLSPVLLSTLSTTTTNVEELTTIESIIKELEIIIAELKVATSNKHTALLKSDVAVVIAAKTGIPVGKLQSQEKERLLNMEGSLKQRLIGQDHAIKSIAEAILESRSGLGKVGQPMGSFFFLGPTGTGKTELAKALAEFLFQDESFMIRFDMSEFKEEHAAALLYGAPPGYVGYEEGGLLVNKIRAKPYSVVLFDEIEKAHQSVFDVFLQIMDEGKLHDKLGKEGDFSNAVIIFTSNIGSNFIVEQFNNNIIPTSNQLLEVMADKFRPEFLGRLTEIIPFAPMTETMVRSILDIQLKGMHQALDKQGIKLTITDEAKTVLAKQGFTPAYGARPLSGVIRSQLRRPLSRKIITGELKQGDTMHLQTNKKDELEWKEAKKKTA